MCPPENSPRTWRHPRYVHDQPRRMPLGLRPRDFIGFDPKYIVAPGGVSATRLARRQVSSFGHERPVQCRTCPKGPSGRFAGQVPPHARHLNLRFGDCRPGVGFPEGLHGYPTLQHRAHARRRSGRKRSGGTSAVWRSHPFGVHPQRIRLFSIAASAIKCSRPV